MRAKPFVSAGGSVQLRAGEMSAPEQVYFVGISPPAWNAVEFNFSDMVFAPWWCPHTARVSNKKMLPRTVVPFIRARLMRANSSRQRDLFEPKPAAHARL